VDEARRIFERMTSYATFRITETLRVLFFVSLSILIYDFYPVTAIMIVLLAILNDIPIMTIASDNAPTADHPVRWNMRRVMTIAGVLSVAGVIESFILFWLLQSQTDFSEQTIQTMMFLKLLVAGHMTIYMTRTQGWFFTKPYPSLLLFSTLEGTQIAGTLFAAFGILVYEITWLQVGIVWGFSLIGFFIIDGLKVLAYRVIGREGQQQPGAGEARPAPA
jgi:H+-transporting ATPase